MKAFLSILRFLPAAMAVVPAVEAAFHGEPGATKAAIAFQAIAGCAKAAGQVIPEEHVQAVSTAIQVAVAALNNSGVFTHGEATGAK